MIHLGFKYIYKDIKTAMYRFNQAYLLDPENADIYWGFGAVYMSLSNYQKAKEQYGQGLFKAPNNTHLLTDYGTYFLSQYYTLAPIKKDMALQNLDTAITYTSKSYALNPTDQDTSCKFFIIIKGPVKILENTIRFLKNLEAIL